MPDVTGSVFRQVEALLKWADDGFDALALALALAHTLPPVRAGLFPIPTYRRLQVEAQRLAIRLIPFPNRYSAFPSEWPVLEMPR